MLYRLFRDEEDVVDSCRDLAGGLLFCLKSPLLPDKSEDEPRELRRFHR